VTDVGGDSAAPLAEDFLVRMNERLRTLAEAEYRSDVGEPTLIVVAGPPRSGTTLALQLLASCLDVGFVDNLAASFWQAPTYGVRLSRKLFPRPFQSSYRSSYGRTAGLDEPHEFGYFWNHLLGFRALSEPSEAQRDAVDWGRVKRVVSNVAVAFGAPWLLKGFQLTWLLQSFTRALPGTIVVRMLRDDIDTACSILRFREGAFGSRRHWASLRPLDWQSWADESPEHQVAAQVLAIQAALDAQLATLPEERLVLAPLDALWRDPGGLVETVAERLAAQGVTVARTNRPPGPFTPPDTRRPAHEAARESRQAVAEAFRSLGRGDAVPSAGARR